MAKWVRDVKRLLPPESNRVVIRILSAPRPWAVIRSVEDRQSNLFIADDQHAHVKQWARNEHFEIKLWRSASYDRMFLLPWSDDHSSALTIRTSVYFCTCRVHVTSSPVNPCRTADSCRRTLPTTPHCYFSSPSVATILASPLVLKE